MEEIYCVFCETEAIRFVEHPDGRMTPLCHSHAEAYVAGQAFPEVRVSILGSDERERVIQRSDGAYFIAPF